MGNAATRSLERVAAAMGELTAAPIQFQAGCDVAQGGVLMALPALLATGLLRYRPAMYQLPDSSSTPFCRKLLISGGLRF